MKSKTLKNFRIYVAGHNGMVGRAVIRYLKKEGVKNIIFADRKKINLLNNKDLEKFIKLSKPNIIINMCWKSWGILANASYPVEFINENIFIQLNLINLAYKLKIKHFINLGSSCIYPKILNNLLENNICYRMSLKKLTRLMHLQKLLD